MAKKKEIKEAKRVSRVRFADCLAFLALILSAILLLAGPLLRKFLAATVGPRLMEITSLIAQYCLLGAVAIPAWYFVRRKGKLLRALYFFCLIVYIAGTVLGIVFGI